MKLFLVRHGETIENVNRINQGDLPGELTENGKRQAKQTAEKLKKEKIDVIFCSDLKRTRDTASEILKFVKADAYYVKELRELNIGEFTGTPYGTISQHIQKNKLDRLTFKPKGGESIQEFKDRICAFYKKILEEHRTENVLFITHEGVIINLLIHILKLKDEYYKDLSQNNAALITVEVLNDGAVKIPSELYNKITARQKCYAIKNIFNSPAKNLLDLDDVNKNLKNPGC